MNVDDGGTTDDIDDVDGPTDDESGDGTATGGLGG